ncbi:cleavage stimulation factor subunit 2-like isoform X2 [Halichondria panicea]|uniref:cleavage stimulation factor subunit 2-like isoform X2 n=1 Tax=Halichondria panicea TaxID=6063 RepID=UPI00312B55AB
MAGMRGREGGRRDEHPKEKAMRSIFVANIAFETTEEQLRTVLSEIGPVMNLKLIYDPATGKPRGFGFCEYKDPQTASSAVRNLAGREVNGRPLRIDSATNAPGGEGSKGPSPPVGGGQPEPPTHGPSVAPENAPEVITKAVASLPPEQMFELMKQMKWFIAQNPQEARQLLLHNPQLAYALLQAQVVMKVVDLETAQNLLHRTPRGPPITQPSQGPPPPQQQHHPPPQQHRSLIPQQHPPSQDPHPPPPTRPYHGPPPPRDDRGPFGGPRMPMPPQDHFRPPMRGHPPEQRGGNYGGPPPPRAPLSRPPPPNQEDGQDQQKAALIMQVLSLSDDQIQMLPPDQRSSILKLREQIARNGP